MKSISKNKIFIFLIFNIISINQILSQKEKTCVEGQEQTCEMKEKSNNNFKDLIFSDYFLKQPKITKENINTSNYNSSEYFDLSVNENILKYISENGVIPYPHQRYIEKQQGNFLHFMHLAYQKNLPVYFTIDQILYPYIEITKQLNFGIIEFVFYPIYKKFISNIINYGIETNYSKGVVLYFSLSQQFLEEEDIYKKISKKNKNISDMDSAELTNSKLCDLIINEIFERDDTDENDYIYNFTLLGHKRALNKLNFVKITKVPKRKNHGNMGNILSQRISNSLRFFQEFIFDSSKELFNIYLIGKIIVESGQENKYKKIKQFIKYFYNEEEDKMNPVEIYHFINDNYKNVINDELRMNKLYSQIKDKLKKKESYKFLKYINFIDEEQKRIYYEEKEKEVNLFSYSLSIEDWVNNKMVNIEKGRLYPSIVEYIDIVYDGKIARNTLLSRFNAKEVSDRIYLYRDGIDMTEDLNHAKEFVEQSLIEEKDKWINSYENSFNYLLYIIGHSANDNDRNELIKSFNTILGSYIHFKKEILLIQQYANITYAKDGFIPDIHFENNTKFYNEIKLVTQKYQEQHFNIIDELEDNDLKKRMKGIVISKLKVLFEAYDYILKILKNTDEKIRQNIIKDAFYYDRKSHQYQGWYVELYKNDYGKTVYDLDIYTSNFYISNPIKQIEFGGVVVYETMTYPEYGLTAINDVDKNKKKMYLFSTYNGNEYPRHYNEKIGFKGLQEAIISRKY